jgi:hypothetical protein
MDGWLTLTKNSQVLKIIILAVTVASYFCMLRLRCKQFSQAKLNSVVFIFEEKKKSTRRAKTVEIPTSFIDRYTILINEVMLKVDHMTVPVVVRL